MLKQYLRNHRKYAVRKGRMESSSVQKAREEAGGSDDEDSGLPREDEGNDEMVDKMDQWTLPTVSGMGSMLPPAAERNLYLVLSNIIFIYFYLSLKSDNPTVY